MNGAHACSQSCCSPRNTRCNQAKARARRVATKGAKGSSSEALPPLACKPSGLDLDAVASDSAGDEPMVANAKVLLAFVEARAVGGATSGGDGGGAAAAAAGDSIVA